jgi:hypothetical protein
MIDPGCYTDRKRRIKPPPPIVEFENALQRVVGKECWSCTIAAGSFLLFDLGKRILRDRPAFKPYLMFEQRHYRGEFSFHVTMCPWRIEFEDEVIGSWNDDNKPGGKMEQNVDRCLHYAVQSVELLHPGLDLNLRFNNTWTLRVFCDRIGEKGHSDNYNYCIHSPVLSTYYSVDSTGILRISRYDEYDR